MGDINTSETYYTSDPKILPEYREDLLDALVFFPVAMIKHADTNHLGSGGGLSQKPSYHPQGQGGRNLKQSCYNQPRAETNKPMYTCWCSALLYIYAVQNR